MLSLDWFCQVPLDFEHKNYLLLQYLKLVDDSFSVRKLSPYLLWTEKLVKELVDFQSKSNSFEMNLRTDIKSIDLVNLKIIRKEIQKNKGKMSSRIYSFNLETGKLGEMIKIDSNASPAWQSFDKNDDF